MAQTAIPMTLEFASVADLERFRDKFERVREDQLPEGIELWRKSGPESSSASEKESRKMTIWWFRDHVAAPLAVGATLALLSLSTVQVDVHVGDNIYNLSRNCTQEEHEREVQAIESGVNEELDKAAEEPE